MLKQLFHSTGKKRCRYDTERRNFCVLVISVCYAFKSDSAKED